MNENKVKRRFGDRYEGRRIRGYNPMDRVAWYIMPRRNGATNLLAYSVDVASMEDYIRQKRAEGLDSFGITHVLLAAYVRTVSQRPALNRFLSGQKLYARNEIWVNMDVKKEMRTGSPDTVIKAVFPKDATARQVYEVLNSTIRAAKEEDSSFDGTARALNYIPGLVLRLVMGILSFMDYFGLIPASLIRVSPFHGSLFFTSMGSLGIPPIYHHLYDFGNLPVFGAFGMKRRAVEVQEDGSVVEKKYVDIKFTMDERIVDGFYYAAFFKHYRRILAHPEILDNPPEEVLSDID